MRKFFHWMLAAILTISGTMTVQAQMMKAADIEKYAKEKHGDKWLDAAKNLAEELTLDKNESLTYQQVILAEGKTKEQLYVALNYWATATFKDHNAITLNDKEAGCIIISSTISNIVEHTGTLNKYSVSITPVIRLDIKEGRVRVTYTVQNYDILRDISGGWLSPVDKDDKTFGDSKRKKGDMTNASLYDEQWEIARHYPFVQKDAQKRTCAKALVMTHAYSNAIIDKVEEALKNGIVGNEDDDWTTAYGTVSHYADVWNPTHREHMATEMRGVAAYMSPGNRFFAPYYRHTTIDAWVTQNEDTIRPRTRLAMADVCAAFDHFQQQRDPSRPLVISGFSQGGMAVVELLKHISDETYRQLAAAYVLGYKVTEADMAVCSHIRPAQGETDTGVTVCYNTVKDVKYIKPVIAASDVCINPVNWRTDAIPATLHDTITIAVSTEHHVLVATGYSASEYPPYKDLINVGDIHSCEPWLYSECLAKNIAVRAEEWRKKQ